MKKSGKLYYKIGEVADMLGVSTSLLRYWEGEFSNINPKSDSSGKRIYTDADINELRYVYYLLKDKKLTIEGAKLHIKDKRHTYAENVSTINVVDELVSIKQKLYDIRNALNQLYPDK